MTHPFGGRRETGASAAPMTGERGRNNSVGVFGTPLNTVLPSSSSRGSADPNAGGRIPASPFGLGGVLSGSAPPVSATAHYLGPQGAPSAASLPGPPVFGSGGLLAPPSLFPTAAPVAAPSPPPPVYGVASSPTAPVFAAAVPGPLMPPPAVGSIKGGPPGPFHFNHPAPHSNRYDNGILNLATLPCPTPTPRTGVHPVFGDGEPKEQRHTSAAVTAGAPPPSSHFGITAATTTTTKPGISLFSASPEISALGASVPRMAAPSPNSLAGPAFVHSGVMQSSSIVGGSVWKGVAKEEPAPPVLLPSGGPRSVPNPVTSSFVKSDPHPQSVSGPSTSGNSSFSAPTSASVFAIGSPAEAVQPHAPTDVASASSPFERSIGARASTIGISNPPHSQDSTFVSSSPFAKVTAAADAPAATTAPTSLFGAATSASGSPAGRGGVSVFASASLAAPLSTTAVPAPALASSFGAAAVTRAVDRPVRSDGAPINRGARGGARRRGRSPPHGQRNAEERHWRDRNASALPHPAPPVQQSRFEIPSPRQAQRTAPLPLPATRKLPEKYPLPLIPSDEKQFCIAARLCKSFLLQLAATASVSGGHASNSSSGTASSASMADEDAAKTLEQAFFGAVGVKGVHGSFAQTTGEMLALWTTQVRSIISGGAHGPSSKAGSNSLAFPGETWIALFALGTYLNTILSTIRCSSASAHDAASSLSASTSDLEIYKAGLRANPTKALTDACHYANELSELLQTVFQRGGEADAPPYSIIPVVLRRVRSVFEEATARGVATVQSNLNAVTSKLFAVLNRRVKASTQQPLNNSNDLQRCLLTWDTNEKEQLFHSFAYLICEMIAADAPLNEDVVRFIDAFHASFPAALAERCMLYYHRACAILRQPLRVPHLEEAADLLAKATVAYPPHAPPQSKRVLLVKLLATEVALGRLPSDHDWSALGVAQLIDVVNALKTSRLDLLDAALSMHGPFFVEIGVHNALCFARQRLALLMVVKFYRVHQQESKIRVADLIQYHRLPYSVSDASMAWLLPLLVEKHINGVLDHDYLILSGKNPFDGYPQDVLSKT